MINEGADSAPRTFRSEFVPRKGARVPVDVQARVLVGDGQVVGVTSIARDLSERDRLENELRQAQKMEAVGRLATGIAHDFNNLITVLLGYSDELIEEAPPNTTLHSAAVEVRRAADRASALTQQLLAFSRRQVVGRARGRRESRDRAHGGLDPAPARPGDPSRVLAAARTRRRSAPTASRSAR